MEDNKKYEFKPIDIQGKQYIPVNQRIQAFHEQYPNGRIITELLTPLDSQLIVMKATITPDIEKFERYFTAYSQEVVDSGYINKTSALENCETSVVGRALAFLGIGIVDAVASSDEVTKAVNKQEKHNFAFEQQTEEVLPSINCLDCGKEFIPKASWAKVCYDCYKKKKQDAMPF